MARFTDQVDALAARVQKLRQRAIIHDIVDIADDMLWHVDALRLRRDDQLGWQAVEFIRSHRFDPTMNRPATAEHVARLNLQAAPLLAQLPEEIPPGTLARHERDGSITIRGFRNWSQVQQMLEDANRALTRVFGTAQ